MLTAFRWKYLFAPLLLIVSCSGCGPEDRDSFGEKAEWSILQGIELEHRTTRLTEPIFEVGDKYEVLGLVGLKGENIWIMLKPTSPPYYKQMPSGNYIVSKNLVTKLVSEHRVSYTVEQVLESHSDQ